MENIVITVIGAIVSIVTCLITTNTKHTVDCNHRQMNNALTSMMRNDIVDIYYRNKDKRKLQQYERETLDKLYDGYIEAGGNSFVKDIYAEMRKWEVER